MNRAVPLAYASGPNKQGDSRKTQIDARNDALPGVEASLRGSSCTTNDRLSEIEEGFPNPKMNDEVRPAGED